MPKPKSPTPPGQYDVGYGRPPVHSRFPLGQSGNPAGRRKGQPTPHEIFMKEAALPIPTKPPVNNGMIAPRDSWMMPPPCNEMIPPGAPGLLAKEVFSPAVVLGQAVLSCLPRVRRRLSPVSSMRCALCTRRSRMASA
jgi:hypothetical protein